MDIKSEATKIAKSAKFGGVSIHAQATADSRLEVTVEARGSVDLPGDSDAVLANILGMLGLGNSARPSPPSEP